MLLDPDETPVSDEGERVAPPTMDGPEAPVPLAQVDHADPLRSSAGGEAGAESTIVTAVVTASEPAAALGPVPLVALPTIPAPLLPPPVPKPKPPIRPERTPEGAWRTDGILVERAAPRSFFITISPPERPSQRIYVHDHAFQQLLQLAVAPSWDTGRLWRSLCDIPLERPLPSRRLEEELRSLLTTFSIDFRS